MCGARSLYPNPVILAGRPHVTGRTSYPCLLGGAITAGQREVTIALDVELDRFAGRCARAMRVGLDRPRDVPIQLRADARHAGDAGGECDELQYLQRARLALNVKTFSFRLKR
jgi:hypothetical protein